MCKRHLRVTSLLCISLVTAILSSAQAENPSKEALHGVADSLIRRLERVTVKYREKRIRMSDATDMYFNVILTDHQGQAICQETKPNEQELTAVTVPASADNLLKILSDDWSVDLYDVGPQGPKRGRYISSNEVGGKFEIDLGFLIYKNQLAGISVYFPFVASNRKMPSISYVYKPFSDRVLELPLDRWEVQGLQSVEGRELLIVNISQPDKATTSKNRFNRTFHRIGFDPLEAYFPVYFEECMDILLDGKIITKSPVIYKKSVFKNFKNFGSFIRFPTSMFELDNDFSGIPDIEKLIKNLDSNGKIALPSPTRVDRIDWELIELGSLAGNPDLWIDIPDNCYVSDAGTKDHYISGLDRAESDKILGVGINPEAELSNPANRWLSRPVLIFLNVFVIGFIAFYYFRKRNK